jgi:uncharacterized membrane protein
MWQEMGLFIQQNIFLRYSTILFIRQRFQRSHMLDNHWHLSGYAMLVCTKEIAFKRILFMTKVSVLIVLPNIAFSIRLRAGRSGDRGSIPDRGRGFLF